MSILKALHSSKHKTRSRFVRFSALLKFLSVINQGLRGRFLWAVLASMFLTGTANAHSPGQSYLYMSLYESVFSARFEVTAGDLNTALGLQLPTDGTLEVEQLAVHEEKIASYLRDRVKLALDDAPVELTYHSTILRDTSVAQYVLTEFQISLPAESPQFVNVEYNVLFDAIPDHKGFLLVENNWRTGTFDNEANISLTFSADDRKARLDLTESTLWSGFLAMLHLGAEHIIEGIDHVLFLMSLLLVSVVRRENGRWQGVGNARSAGLNLLKLVTAFTVAHSITLSLTVLGTLAIEGRIVESIIAASIVIAALEVFFPIFRSWFLLIVFVFGLFHGAGFAGILLEMNIHSDYLFLTLLGFNLGVEIGQVAIALVIFPILYLVRSRRAYLSFGMQATASCLILVASYWFIERAFNVDLPAGEYAQRLIGLFI